jgi:pyruvate/2-oxoglutarate dehydrogenase complex dihydrolipoamide dehydrogenase (E3) component
MSVTEVRGDADAALREIWTNREVTGMKTVPRRLLLFGGGPIGVEMAQAVHRLDGEVALVNGPPNLLFHDARPLGEALAQVPREEAIELFLDAAAAARREGDEYILDLDDGTKLSGDRLLGRHRTSVPDREPRPRNGWRGG